MHLMVYKFKLDRQIKINRYLDRYIEGYLKEKEIDKQIDIQNIDIQKDRFID